MSHQLSQADQEQYRRDGFFFPLRILSSEEAAIPVENPGVVQAMLEGSNIKPIIEMSKLIETQRAYESVRKFIDSEDERIKSMVRELGRTT